MTNTKPAKSIQLDLQIATNLSSLPKRSQFKQWVTAALLELDKSGSVLIRLVDVEESASLNQQYRHKVGPTNILSFPADLPAGIKTPWLGDLVICVPLVIEEARAAGRPVTSHWAHLVIHGVLHLLGYDHIEEKDAVVMETLETKILADLSIANPYTIDY